MTLSHTDGTWPTHGMTYGGDYNPEQWGRDVWSEDVRLMREAGVNLVSLGIFSWGLLEPADGEYDWEWFDRIVDLLGENGVAINLATPTAAPPDWLHLEHPEILHVEQDMTAHWPGARLGWCPSSPVFREYSLRIVRALAERYGERDHVVMWHVGNEFGGGNGYCYCDVSAVAFRKWLKRRYGGLEGVNSAWGTAFWGHVMHSWEAVLPPRGPGAKNPSLVLDYDRFCSDELLGQYLAERSLLKEVTPHLPVTTNFMVGAEADAVDYPRWAPHMDVLANDHYTRSADPLPQQDVAFSGDRMRSMTTQRRPWLLMEHSTAAVNWQPRNRAKLPGEMVRNSLSHIAHGADGAMFFQWRASRAGAEQFHSAMVPHGGEDTDIFRSVVELGANLRSLAPVQGSRVPQGRVGILFDDHAGWALQKGVKPNNSLQYGVTMRSWHRALWRRGIVTDVLGPWQELDGYETIVVPSLFLISEEDAARITAFAEAGGQVIVTSMSGIVDANNQVRLGGYPGAFRDLLGVLVEEFHPLQEAERFRLDTGWSGEEWTEHLRPQSADVVARYVDGPLAGRPAITRRDLDGGGCAVYVSANLDDEGVDALALRLVPDAGPLLPAGIERLERLNETERFTFFINHTADDQLLEVAGHELLTDSPVDGRLRLPAGMVRVVRSSLG